MSKQKPKTVVPSKLSRILSVIEDECAIYWHQLHTFLHAAEIRENQSNLRFRAGEATGQNPRFPGHPGYML